MANFPGAKQSPNVFPVTEGAVYLSAIFPLRHGFVVCFCSNGVSCRGAFHLAEVLKKNKTLDIVDLSFNRLEDEGASYLGKVLSSPNCGLKA